MREKCIRKIAIILSLIALKQKINTEIHVNIPYLNYTKTLKYHSLVLKSQNEPFLLNC